ncbi:Protein of unknown function DUF2458 [Penicillium cosmopolitanum]|uniref:Uncharacterized protein n=1 Tax=Penicillium cosmopolitanum TaxID=1131564 RepID=A0A9W9VZC2_9EURO|nr:Protein of unknown function DUF2458 [Penicillium cosmopolitanum]KAJ5392199.1 Protein of unknown function DUF2458 [Penicillium cosmopolitanum]
MEYPYNSSDLDSVLKTLSGLASQQQSSQSTSTPPSRSETPQQRPQRPKEVQAPPRPPSNPPKPSTSTTDASSITTWPAALRHVMRIVGQNEETQLRIRGLIHSQHSHERQWWKSREALVLRQQSRGEEERARRSITIYRSTHRSKRDIAQDDKAELDTYDAKVYKVSAKMATALMSELRGLDIPFFALKQSLVVDSDRPSEVNGLDSGKVTKAELLELQRRMLGLLEDLCKE